MYSLWYHLWYCFWYGLLFLLLTVLSLLLSYCFFPKTNWLSRNQVEYYCMHLHHEWNHRFFVQHLFLLAHSCTIVSFHLIKHQSLQTSFLIACCTIIKQYSLSHIFNCAHSFFYLMLCNTTNLQIDLTNKF